MITTKIANVIKEIGKKLNMELENINVIESNRKDLCDYQFDGTFQLAKTLHKSPLEIGQMLVEEIKKHPEYSHLFQNVEVIPPGFLNFTLVQK